MTLRNKNRTCVFCFEQKCPVPTTKTETPRRKRTMRSYPREKETRHWLKTVTRALVIPPPKKIRDREICLFPTGLTIELIVNGTDDNFSKELVIKVLLGRLDVKRQTLKISNVTARSINETKTILVSFRTTGECLAKHLADDEDKRAFKYAGMDIRVQAGEPRNLCFLSFTPLYNPLLFTEREDKVVSFRVRSTKKHKVKDAELSRLQEKQFRTIRNFKKRKLYRQSSL